MLGYAALKPARTASSAFPSSPLDCHPDRTTVPDTLDASKDGPLLASLGAPDVASALVPGLAAEPAAGDPPPELQALKIRTNTAARAATRQSRRMCSPPPLP